MKNPINKRVLRQIFDSPARILPIFLAMIFVVVFSSSFFTSQDSIKALYYKQLDEGKVEDGQFTTINPLTDDLIKKVQEKNVKIYKNFYIELDQGKDKELKVFQNREKINKALIFDGRLASAKNEAAISANYARANNIKLDDSIKIGDKSFKIVGLISLPDYSSLLKNRNDLVMDTGYFGTCLLNKQGFESFKDSPVKYTYSYHREDQLEKKEALDQLRDIVKIINRENMVIDGVIREDNHCITYIMDDMEGDVPTMTTFMVILFIALAFISSVQIKSLIEKEAPVIGSLLASGYTKRELLVNYMKMPLILTILSAIFGNIIAYIYAYKKYATLYYTSFDLPVFQAKLGMRSFLLTSVIPLLIYLIVNFIVISRSLRFKPLDFLRGNLRTEKKKSKLKLNSFNFISRVKIRMILDNKLNILALVFGVFLANIILIFGLSMKPIMLNYAEKMGDSMKYNHTYMVKMAEAGIKADKAHIIEGRLVDYDDKKVQIYGLDKGSKFNMKEPDSLNGNEIIASRSFMNRFSLKIGDKIKVKEPYKDNEISLTIKAVDEDNSFFQLFIPRNNLNRLLDKDKDLFNSYLSDESLNISKENLITEIDRRDMSKTADHFLENFSVAFEMFFYIGIAFYIIITFIVLNIIFDKSRINISYLKVFGFSDKEIISIYANSIFIFLIAFQVLMIPILDKLIKYLIFVSMDKLDAYIIADIPMLTYFKNVIYSIFIFIFMQIIQHIKISKLDMVKELKVING